MAKAPVIHWTDDMTARFDREIFTGRHELAASGLFTDEALIAAFEAHNKVDMQIATMGYDPARLDEWKLGSVGGADGREILEAIRSGRLWLNMLHLDRNEVYRKLMDDMFEEFGFDVVQKRVTAIVSSPGAQVLYHIDPEQVLLLHVRGHKTIYIYPANDWTYADPDDLERIFTGEAYEEIRFDPAWDAAAAKIDLGPGWFVSWPQNGPHRVENGNELNVSLSCSFYTKDAKKKERVYRANRYFRQFAPGHFRDRHVHGLGPAAKILAFRTLQKLGIRTLPRVRDTKQFVVDPYAEGGRRLIEP